MGLFWCLAALLGSYDGYPGSRCNYAAALPIAGLACIRLRIAGLSMERLVPKICHWSLNILAWAVLAE